MTRIAIGLFLYVVGCNPTIASEHSKTSPIQDAIAACQQWIDNPRGFDFSRNFYQIAHNPESTTTTPPKNYLSRTHPIKIETLELLDSRFPDETSSNFYCVIENVDTSLETNPTAQGRQNLPEFSKDWQPLSRSAARHQIKDILDDLQQNPAVVETTMLFEENYVDRRSFVACKEGPIREVLIWKETGPPSTLGADWSVTLSLVSVANQRMKTLAQQLRQGQPGSSDKCHQDSRP